MNLVKGAFGLNVTIDDRQFMQLIIQKDAAAFEELYDRYDKWVYHFAFRIVKDSVAAEEIMQELFLRIWHQAEHFDHNQDKLSTWMFMITRNIAIDHLRSRGSRILEPSVESDPAYLIQDESSLTEEILEMRAIGEQVRVALQELSVDQQQVMEMIYYQGFTQHEVAEIVSIPLVTVKSRVRLAMKQLQQRLSHWGRRGLAHE